MILESALGFAAEGIFVFAPTESFATLTLTIDTC